MKLINFQVAINKAEVRSEDGSIIIEGIASTPQIDRHNSIITVDAIRNGMGNYLNNPIILLGHDTSKVIGLMTEHSVDESGLKIKARIVKDTDGVFGDIKGGLTKGFSVGFYPLEWSYEDKNGIPLSAMTQEQIDNLDYNDVIRKITKIDLIEISVVNTPSNPSALFSLSKAVKLFFEDYEKRSVLKMQKRVLVSEEDNPFTDSVKPTEDKETTEEDKEEVTEDETKETVAEPTEDKEDETKKDESKEDTGDEVETTGEIPVTPQEEDSNPTIVEETPQEDPKVELQAIVDDCFDVIDKQERRIKHLESLLDKIPSKRGFVTIGGSKEKDPLLSDMIAAKEKAGNFI